jgi:hypothetical protein
MLFKIAAMLFKITAMMPPSSRLEFSNGSPWSNFDAGGAENWGTTGKTTGLEEDGSALGRGMDLDVADILEYLPMTRVR